MAVIKWAMSVTFGATAALLVVLFATGVSSHTGTAFILLGLAVLCGLLVRFFWWVWRVQGPALTVRVDRQAIELLRQGQTVDSIERDRVGVVVIEEAGPRGVTAYRIYGPDQVLAGSWDTNWIGKSTLASTRAFNRYGYPWLVDDYVTVAGPVKRRSKNAPDWAERVVRH
jgi:hypothetical protein